MKLSSDLENEITDAGAKVCFQYPWWLRPFLMRGVVGITLGRRIYFASEVSARRIEPLLRHELAHVRQIGRHGLIGFYARYVGEFVGNLRRGMNASEAYRNISFEREAFEAEQTAQDV